MPFTLPLNKMVAGSASALVFWEFTDYGMVFKPRGPLCKKTGT